MRVKSIVDMRFKLFIFMVIGALAGMAVYLAQALMLSLQEALFGYLAVLLVSGLLLWLLYGTYYELRADDLLCRSGPFVEIIPYDSIIQIAMTENTFSSMALSAHRLEILQHDGYISGITMISPRSRELFMARLRQRCVNLKHIA